MSLIPLTLQCEHMWTCGHVDSGLQILPTIKGIVDELHNMRTVMFGCVTSLDVCGSSAVHGAGPGQVSAGGAAVLRHRVLHLREHGALELLPEVIAHENIQHRVEEAVCRCHRRAYFESRDQGSTVVVLVVQLEQDEHVVGQPADEESSDQGAHHFEGFVGLGHPAAAELEDDDGVANNDDDEWDYKPGNEAAHGNYFVTVLM